MCAGGYADVPTDPGTSSAGDVGWTGLPWNGPLGRIEPSGPNHSTLPRPSQQARGLVGLLVGGCRSFAQARLRTRFESGVSHREREYLTPYLPDCLGVGALLPVAYPTRRKYGSVGAGRPFRNEGCVTGNSHSAAIRRYVRRPGGRRHCTRTLRTLTDP